MKVLILLVLLFGVSACYVGFEGGRDHGHHGYGHHD